MFGARRHEYSLLDRVTSVTRSSSDRAVRVDLVGRREE